MMIMFSTMLRTVVR